MKMSLQLVTVARAALIAGAVFAFSSPLAAQDGATPGDDQFAQMWGDGGGWGGGPGWMGQGGGWMRHGWMGRGMAIDLDGDGLVSADEAAAHAEQMFTAFDLDGDDTVTEDEFMEHAFMGGGQGRGWMMRPWRGGGQRMFRRRAERFESFDSDGDGKLTASEFIGSAKEAFEAADADGDGEVTVWEFRAQRRSQ